MSPPTVTHTQHVNSRYPLFQRRMCIQQGWSRGRVGPLDHTGGECKIDGLTIGRLHLWHPTTRQETVKLCYRPKPRSNHSLCITLHTIAVHCHVGIITCAVCAFSFSLRGCSALDAVPFLSISMLVVIKLTTSCYSAADDAPPGISKKSEG